MTMLKDNGAEIGRKVFEVAFGVGVVVALSILSRNKDIHSIVDDTAVGLLSIMAVAFILEPISQKRATRELRASIQEVETVIHEMKKSINSVGSNFADRVERYTLALRFLNKNLDRDEMPSAWEQMLWAMRGNLDATTFVKPSDYSSSYPDLGIEIQRTKVQVSRVRIRRIFIIESENELEMIKPHIKRQIAARVEVSYVMLGEILRQIDVTRYETLDFGIFEESKSVFLWLLNERVVSGGRIELDTDRTGAYEKYHPFFEQLCRMSHDFPSEFYKPQELAP
jgi:hypothetical protein